MLYQFEIQHKKYKFNPGYYKMHLLIYNFLLN